MNLGNRKRAVTPRAANLLVNTFRGFLRGREHEPALPDMKVAGIRRALEAADDCRSDRGLPVAPGTNSRTGRPANWRRTCLEEKSSKLFPLVVCRTFVFSLCVIHYIPVNKRSYLS